MLFDDLFDYFLYNELFNEDLNLYQFFYNEFDYDLTLFLFYDLCLLWLNLYFLRFLVRFLCLNALILSDNRRYVRFFVVCVRQVREVSAFSGIAGGVRVVNGDVGEEFVGTAIRASATLLNDRRARIIAYLRVVPILLSATIVARVSAFNGAVRLIRYFALRRVARPATNVSFFIRPERQM